jgi:hypothetical protein
MATAKRPVIVTALGVLGIIGGISSIMGGLFMALTNDKAALASSMNISSSAVTYVGWFAVLLGAFSIFLAASILSGQKWARVWYTVVGALNIVSGIGMLFASHGGSKMSGLTTAILWVITLQLLYSEKADKFFEE